MTGRAGTGFPWTSASAIDTTRPGQSLQVTEKGSAYLRSRLRSDRPFFMLAGYLAPHFPLIIPEKWWKHYADRVPMPRIPPGLLNEIPLNYKHLRIGFNMEDVPPETVKLGRELYYGFVEWLDDQIGKLLAALEDSGQAENTVVIYTADHGENMGEHGLWWKNCMYDHAARVPLIISWPARWTGGQRRSLTCSHLDLVQTIAEIAGCKCPDDWDGDSMCAWLDDGKTPWKDRAISQYYAHNITSGFVMLRQGPYKYVYHSPPDEHHSAQEELYDLRSDPGEFHNLASRPEHRTRCAAMLAAIVKEIGEHPDEVEERCRRDIRKGYGRPPRKQGWSGANERLRNTRFRQGDRFWSHRGVSGRYTVDPAAGPDGGPAILYRKSADDPQPLMENSHIEQSVRVQPHARYRVRMRVKAAGDLHPILRVADFQSKTIAQAIAGDSRDWQTVETEFDAGDHTAVRVQFFGGVRSKLHEAAPGVSWLAEIVLEPIGGAPDAQ